MKSYRLGSIFGSQKFKFPSRYLSLLYTLKLGENWLFLKNLK